MWAKSYVFFIHFLYHSFVRLDPWHDRPECQETADFGYYCLIPKQYRCPWLNLLGQVKIIQSVMAHICLNLQLQISTGKISI